MINTISSLNFATAMPVIPAILATVAIGFVVGLAVNAALAMPVIPAILAIVAIGFVVGLAVYTALTAYTSWKSAKDQKADSLAAWDELDNDPVFSAELASSRSAQSKVRFSDDGYDAYSDKSLDYNLR